MLLIADSGSSKTDWRILDGENINQARTQGLNPYYQNTHSIQAILEKELIPQIKSPSNIKQVFFYGAGCSNKEAKIIVEGAFKNIFAHAKYEINHDLIGAARATCGYETGIACILGTGSNSCVYDGKSIIENIPSLGFILGDEGSGAILGRALIKDYLEKELPKDLQVAFAKRYSDVTLQEILFEVYKKPFPNRYLAGYTKFLYDHKKHPYVYELISLHFSHFLEKQVIKYQHYRNYPVHFVGSIAFYFSDVLRKVAKKYALNIQHIIESPIAGLTLYHQQTLNEYT